VEWRNACGRLRLPGAQATVNRNPMKDEDGRSEASLLFRTGHHPTGEQGTEEQQIYALATQKGYWPESMGQLPMNDSRWVISEDTN